MRLDALPAFALGRYGTGTIAAAHAATLATAGETLWFHGQRALGYFHKDCGGRTATPAEIWPRAQPVAYLPSPRIATVLPMAGASGALSSHALS